MRSLALTAASMWMLACAGVAQAQDAPQTCRIHQNNQWQEVGVGSATSCLKAIDRWVDQYNPQGFKFGAWSGLMLATDPDYYYQSQDQGKTWKPIGRKSELTKATRLARDMPGPKGTQIAVSAAEARICSVSRTTGWTEKRNLTLEQCANAMLRELPADDPKAHLYGYWSGVFLAASRDGVLRSHNGSDWIALRGSTNSTDAAPPQP